MSVLIKICGLSTPESLDVALDAGADMVGFVFFAPSPRNLAFDAARDDALLSASVEALRPDLLQLHGREPPERVAAIKAAFKLPVMKAIAVETRADLAAVARYANVADRLIFDARAPREATRPGGLGKPFDWRLLQNLDPALPYMLSGGLDAGNVSEALHITRAPGVDVSSGVERAPGDKDPDKIRAFVRAARQAASGRDTKKVASSA
jgi:phosphoribosylanthranilate isomerase